MAYRIPFNRPTQTDRDLANVQEALANGHLSGDGRFTKHCHRIFEETLGVPKVLLTTSCTHALEMAAFLLDIKPGDEVIVPAFTFVSSVNAFVIRGARPVFCDVRPGSFCIDERQLEQLITPKTRAIVVVHYAGIGCQMDVIGEIAKSRGITVIEDNAHGLYGKFQGQWLGTFSDMATLSFHETKNFSCGEGGALLLSNPSLIERAEVIREKGTDRSKFHRGQVDKYSWVDLGSSYLPSEVLAAILAAQLDDRENIQARRHALWGRYDRELRDWTSSHDVAVPEVPPDRSHSAHMYFVVLPTVAFRDGLVAHLKAHDILAVSHYVPLNVSPMGQRLGGRPGDCPVAERLAERLLRLPFFTQMTDAEQSDVIQAVSDYRPS
ncbi:MAG: dTDP-4-amino-4,6-dideoxygalactose transaminase [Vicinamibacterales bacterium]